MANLILESLVFGGVIRTSGLAVESNRGASVANSATPGNVISMRQPWPACRPVEPVLGDPKVAYATQGTIPGAGRSRRQVSLTPSRALASKAFARLAILPAHPATRTPPASTGGTQARLS
jgi:hypothetical protein